MQQALSLPTFETGGVTYLTRLTLAIRDGRIERTIYPVKQPGAHSRDVLVWLNELVSRKSALTARQTRNRPVRRPAGRFARWQQ